MVAYQSKTGGPRSRDLTVGKVLVNLRQEQSVTVQPYRGQWSGMKVVHLPQFQTPNGYSDSPVPNIAKEQVRYEALVLQVELLVGGELTHGSARTLHDRG